MWGRDGVREQCVWEMSVCRRRMWEIVYGRRVCVDECVWEVNICGRKVCVRAECVCVLVECVCERERERRVCVRGYVCGMRERVGG